MLVSVIIPTYKREAVLRETLAGLLQQEGVDFEVLVVDQTITHAPETEAYLNELATRQRIQWLRVPWANLPRARNYGVQRSLGDPIIFIDDDVQLPRQFLAAHVRPFQEQPQVGAVAGRVLDRSKLVDSGGSPIITDLPPQSLDPAIGWYFIDLVHTIKPQRVLTTRGCNMSFRRSLFTQHHLTFDERFRGSAIREESDFCLRVQRAGFQVWYEPAAHLVHLGETTGGCHDLDTRSLSYQLTFYHNHFWMGLKNLTLCQNLRFFSRLFDCHVLGHPPCHKSQSPLKILTRLCFYLLGLLAALATLSSSVLQKRLR